MRMYCLANIESLWMGTFFFLFFQIILNSMNEMIQKLQNEYQEREIPLSIYKTVFKRFTGLKLNETKRNFLSLNLPTKKGIPKVHDKDSYLVSGFLITFVTSITFDILWLLFPFDHLSDFYSLSTICVTFTSFRSPLWLLLPFDHLCDFYSLSTICVTFTPLSITFVTFIPFRPSVWLLPPFRSPLWLLFSFDHLGYFVTFIPFWSPLWHLFPFDHLNDFYSLSTICVTFIPFWSPLWLLFPFDHLCDFYPLSITFVTFIPFLLTCSGFAVWCVTNLL